MSKLNYRGLDIVTKNAEYAEDPREWGSISKMICFHKRYSLGDSHKYNSDYYAGWEEIESQIFEDYSPILILPLYLYDHSGITISTSPFGCRWDSGQVGFVFVTKESYTEYCGEFKGTEEEYIVKCGEILDQEVKVYDDYLCGDVYDIEVYDGDDLIESYPGCYGEEDLKTEITIAKSGIDIYISKKQTELQVLNSVQLKTCLV